MDHLHANQLSYEIIGEGMQFIEVTLSPAQTIIAEGGVMNYLEQGITFQTLMGDGTVATQGFFKKMYGASKRMLGGESVFLTHFTNSDSTTKKMAFAAPHPGKIIPISLSEVGGSIKCQKGTFLCAEKGTTLDICFMKRIGVGLFGGEGFIMQQLMGQGIVFLQGGGSILCKTLNNETLYVDVGCVAAFTQDIDYQITRAGNLKSMFLGGQGRFLAKLSGTGRVYIQSIPFSRLADRIIANAPEHGGKAGGEGSILGRMGRIISGGD